MTISDRPSASVRRIGALPKSMSGPRSSGQVSDLLSFRTRGRYLPGQSRTYESFAITCFVHRRLPLSRSNAMTASDPGAAGSVYALPVATYTARRLRSTDGADQTPAPAGPHSSVPFEVFFRSTAFSGIVKDVQRRFPVTASYDARPPRNEQHG